MEKIFQVSEFNEYIALYLSQVGLVTVEGEISELKVSADKYLYITIKDKESSLSIFGFTFKIYNYQTLEVGMLVHILGRPNLYQKTARFSLTAEQIIPAGEGALRVAFEKLKLKLDQEGLFAVARKRALPLFPGKIGLITAKGSQAYNDFVKVLGERSGGIKISFYPVQVQGKESVASIISAFEYFNSRAGDFDLLAVVRGGGSLEDLISFNDEKVVRAIFSSKVPVVCGVGHEGDISLADLVADLRASTPSNAAELIVRQKEEVLRQVNGSILYIENRIESKIREMKSRIYLAVSRLEGKAMEPGRKLTGLTGKLNREFVIFGQTRERFSLDTDNQKNYLFKAVISWNSQNKIKLGNLTRLLTSLDYKQVMKRGFSIISKNGKIVRSINDLKPGEKIKNLLVDGTVGSEVLETEVTNE